MDQNQQVQPIFLSSKHMPTHLASNTISKTEDGNDSLFLSQIELQNDASEPIMHSDEGDQQSLVQLRSM